MPNAFAGTLSGNVKATGQSAVVLETVPAKAFPAPNQNAAMDQRGMKFVPALLVIQQGTTVVFSNDDSVAHNILWPNISGNKGFAHNVGTFNKGKTLSFKYDNVGNVPLLCTLHPEMSGTIVVSPSPYFRRDGCWRLLDQGCPGWHIQGNCVAQRQGYDRHGERERRHQARFLTGKLKLGPPI